MLLTTAPLPTNAVDVSTLSPEFIWRTASPFADIDASKVAFTAAAVSAVASAIVGLLCSQNYIPLFEMTSAPLRLEITIVDL